MRAKSPHLRFPKAALESKNPMAMRGCFPAFSTDSGNVSAQVLRRHPIGLLGTKDSLNVTARPGLKNQRLLRLPDFNRSSRQCDRGGPVRVDPPGRLQTSSCRAASLFKQLSKEIWSRTSYFDHAGRPVDRTLIQRSLEVEDEKTHHGRYNVTSSDDDSCVRRRVEQANQPYLGTRETCRCWN